MNRHKILIVDDENSMLDSLNTLLSEKYDAFIAFSGTSALEIIKSKDIELVITDLVMPEMDGIELLENIKQINPEIPVLVMTGHGTVETAVETIKKGAIDFIEKPIQVDKLLNSIENILKFRSLEIKDKMNKRKLRLEEDNLVFIAEHSSMKKMLNRISALSHNNSNVLITGPQGTGKELLGKIIHKNSSKREFPFVKLNCSLLNEENFDTLMIKEDKKHPENSGLFHVAHGGALFLDHIEKLNTATQSKLVTLLKSGYLNTENTKNPKKLDVRIIATSNHELSRLVDEGSFQEELYYLINILDFNIPPLVERKEDIMPIANHFLETFSKDANKEFKGFTMEVDYIFKKYNWPGNVRELENVVERAVITADRVNIGSKFLPVGMKHNKRSPEITLRLFSERMEEAEEALIRYCLHKYEGNIMKASTAMGITRATLYNKIKRYKMDN